MSSVTSGTSHEAGNTRPQFHATRDRHGDCRLSSPDQPVSISRSSQNATTRVPPQPRQSVLIVEDSTAQRMQLGRLIQQLGSHECIAHSDPEEALSSIAHRSVDLVLVDYMMPQMSGIEMIRRLRRLPHGSDVPIVMITSADDPNVLHEALSAGATEFLRKPADLPQLKVRIGNLLELRKTRNALFRMNQTLQAEVEEATKDLELQQDEIIFRLARAAEYRDTETAGHLKRMSAYCYIIAKRLGLDERECRDIERASKLHDIGKVAISDAILHKPGPLTPDERADMRQHTHYGSKILGGSRIKLVQYAEEIASYHHERWDGEGYPTGLKATAIPLRARIAAVADVFDALTSNRPYKKSWPFDEALSYLVEQSGSQFDPVCVFAFACGWDDIKTIHEALAGEEAAPTG